MTHRDVDCYYSSIPILDGYKRLIGSSMDVQVEYKDDSILINGVENILNSENGCKTIAPTEAPTEAPEDTRRIASVL